MVRRLQQHWITVLTSFFPRWRAGSKWRCTTRTSCTAHGFCDRERQVIEIGIVYDDDDELDLLLIHEIAHAVASEYHGATWQRRMASAATTARSLNRSRLAELLDSQIIDYRDRGGPDDAFDDVRAALLDNPDATFTQIKRWLAKMYGARVSEVDKGAFRGLRKAYENARKEAIELLAQRRNLNCKR